MNRIKKLIKRNKTFALVNGGRAKSQYIYYTENKQDQDLRKTTGCL